MRKLLSAMAVVFSTGMIGSVCAQDFEKGVRAFETGDYATAVKEWWFLAERGDAQAQVALGARYFHGQGVIQDYKEAVKWWHRSAEGGNASAQDNLGWMYRDGRGIIQNNVYAHVWFNIAASNGYKGSSEQRDETAKKMTAEEIAKAQELARECVNKQYKGC